MNGNPIVGMALLLSAMLGGFACSTATKETATNESEQALLPRMPEVADDDPAAAPYRTAASRDQLLQAVADILGVQSGLDPGSGQAPGSAAPPPQEIRAMAADSRAIDQGISLLRAILPTMEFPVRRDVEAMLMALERQRRVLRSLRAYLLAQPRVLADLEPENQP